MLSATGPANPVTKQDAGSDGAQGRSGMDRAGAGLRSAKH